MIIAIFNAIAAIPALLTAIKSLVGWLSIQIETYEKKKLMEDMAKAIEKAQEKKDTSGLDHAFDPDKGSGK